MEPSRPVPPSFGEPPAAPVRDRYWLHLLLFGLTVLSTILAGGQFVARTLLYEATDLLSLFTDPYFLLDGGLFAASLLGFLTVHEFGHYFAARHHRVSASLPYYIPFPPYPFLSIGTFGAVIRIRQPIPSLRTLFDIGAAGPLAGFVVALGVLIYALVTLPPPEYLLDLEGHEALKAYILEHGAFPPERLDEGGDSMTIVIGQTPLYWLLTRFVEHAPPMHEMYHYPVLFGGWLALFFTALNLLPVGQLDGGHILYALVGPRWHTRLARGFVLLLLTSGTIGFVTEGIPGLIQEAWWYGALGWLGLSVLLYLVLGRVFDRNQRRMAPAMLLIVFIAIAVQTIGGPLLSLGWSGWLFWVMLIAFVIRIEHPPVARREPLTTGRRVLAWLSILIFVLCFSLRPISVIVG
ncbi:MAG: site-2 protease family protein [Bacteroidota bacterium]